MRGLTQSPEQRVLKRWTRALEDADRTDLATLKTLSTEGHALRQSIDAFLHKADGLLSQAHVGAAEVPRPLHSDWAFRPGLWTGPIRPQGIAEIETGTTLGGDGTLFHDSALSELTFRQIRSIGPDDPAPFAVRLDVFGFEGSFLSVVIDLPAAALSGLQKRHIIAQTLVIETEAPLEAFSRLNIKHGPNTEQIVRELPSERGTIEVEFDLAYTELDEQRAERMWVDLILEGPKMNQILVRDMTFSRRPRAEM